MSNVFKTAFLLALLTAMLVLLGGAVGGRQGMLIAFFMAMVMNFVSYWWSDKIVLKMYGAQPIEEAQAPGLYGMVHRLASKAAHPDAARLHDPE
jgi:heat shock protein HtpX